MHFKGHRKRHKPSNRATSSVMAVLGVTLRIVLPLVVITGVASWILTRSSDESGPVRVTTSVPGADIFVGGTMTGMQSDTTLMNVPVGRQLITVRKPGFVSDPEVIVADVQKDRITQAAFVLRSEQANVRTDSIPPLRNVRQEIFSTGEPVRHVPAASYRQERRLVNFAPSPRAPREPAQMPVVDDASETGAEAPADRSAQADAPLEGTQITVSSHPDGAQIVVNSTLTSRLTPYTFQGLEAGMYIFSLVMPGYKVKPESVTVILAEDYQSELAAFELEEDVSLPRPILTLTTTPPAAGIRVNGKPAGVGKVTVESTYGKHVIEFVEVPGYKTPAPQTVELTVDNPNADVTGEYVKISGNSYLAVLPSEDLGTEFESGILSWPCDESQLRRSLFDW